MVVQDVFVVEHGDGRPELAFCVRDQGQDVYWFFQSSTTDDPEMELKQMKVLVASLKEIA
jgi:hypothetical protein